MRLSRTRARATLVDDDDGDGDGEQRCRRCARDVVRCVDVVAWKKNRDEDDEDDENAGSL